MVGFPDLDAPLSDGVVSLRFTAERDIPEILIAYQDDRELDARLGEDRPPSGAQLGQREEDAAARRRSGRGVTLAITAADTDVCCGEVRVHHVDLEHDTAELALWLAPQVRGRGWGPRALELASGWLTGPCEVVRLTIRTEPGNAAMRATAERAGFRFEGVLRGYTLERGVRMDNALFARIRE